MISPQGTSEFSRNSDKIAELGRLLSDTQENARAFEELAISERTAKEWTQRALEKREARITKLEREREETARDYSADVKNLEQENQRVQVALEQAKADAEANARSHKEELSRTISEAVEEARIEWGAGERAKLEASLAELEATKVELEAIKKTMKNADQDSARLHCQIDGVLRQHGSAGMSLNGTGLSNQVNFQGQSLIKLQHGAEKVEETVVDLASTVQELEKNVRKVESNQRTTKTEVKKQGIQQESIVLRLDAMNSAQLTLEAALKSKKDKTHLRENLKRFISPGEKSDQDV